MCLQRVGRTSAPTLRTDYGNEPLIAVARAGADKKNGMVFNFGCTNYPCAFPPHDIPRR